MLRKLGNSILPVGVSSRDEARHCMQMLLLVGSNADEAKREVSLRCSKARTTAETTEAEMSISAVVVLNLRCGKWMVCVA